MSILFNEAKNLFLISTDQTSYGMEISPSGGLVHRYWGTKLERTEDLPHGIFPAYDTRKEATDKHFANQEYAPAGGLFFNEPCIKATYPDGCRDTKLFYKGHEIIADEKSETLIIELKEEIYPLSVKLYYRIYKGLDVLDRWSEIKNEGDAPIQLESVQTAVYHFSRARQYRLTHMSGKWSGEYQLQRMPLTRDKIVVESRNGVSGHDSVPWFAIDEGISTETIGDVWAGALQWSGNWKIAAEVDHDEQTRVTMGLNDYDFAWNLEPAEVFTTPIATAVFSREGFGGASRRFHKYQIEHLLPSHKAKDIRPIVYNSWGVFEFDIDVEQQMKLAERAAKIGVELFVMDDGWFSTRDNDHSGLGDWYPSKTKFPNGLKPLIDHVTGLGMKFGIWVEPEMVNPDSDLYRTHPEWVLHCPGKEISTWRHQYTLNFAREDVCEYMWNFLEDLLANNDIGFLKWDMNRYLCEVSWPDVPREKQKEVWTRYVYNVHKLFNRIQERFPDVLVENCASGGGRIDLGMVGVCDFMAPSDCGDPLDKIKIFEGFTQLFHPKIETTWFGDNPTDPRGRKTPLSFRVNQAMLGNLSLGMNLLIKNDDELAELKEIIERYKDIRELIQCGDQYRLVSIYGDQMSAYEYVAPDGSDAVLFTFGKSMQFMWVLPRIQLKGLDPDALYTVNGGRPISGRGLMTIGIEPQLLADFDSRMYRITKV